MLRYVLTLAGAVALISNVAMAETFDYGDSSTKVITKSAPFGEHKKVVIHRHDDGFGSSKKVVIHRHDDGFGPSKKVVIKRHDDGFGGGVVTKKKIVREGMTGSSMGRITTHSGDGGVVVHR